MTVLPEKRLTPPLLTARLTDNQHLMMTRGLLALSIAALGLAAAHVHATPLDADACAKLKIERGVLEQAGVRGNMAKGAEWAKANLSEDKLQQIKRVIDLDGQLLFRCTGQTLVELPASVEADPAAAPPPEAEEGKETPATAPKADGEKKAPAVKAPAAKTKQDDKAKPADKAKAPDKVKTPDAAKTTAPATKAGPAKQPADKAQQEGGQPAAIQHSRHDRTGTALIRDELHAFSLPGGGPGRRGGRLRRGCAGRCARWPMFEAISRVRAYHCWTLIVYCAHSPRVF